jgi:DNA-binding transcriptional LysR family regulator
LLLELTMVLLVPKASPLKSATEIWRQDKINEPLICLPAQEMLTRMFQAKLADLGTEWFPTIEASSTDLIETYVASGLGIGLSVAVPGKKLPEHIRALPLKKFPPALIGAMWHGKTTPLLDSFLDMTRQRAQEIARKYSVS